MFSLGMVIAAIYNDGKSLIQANYSNSEYIKQLDSVRKLILLFKIIFLFYLIFFFFVVE